MEFITQSAVKIYYEFLHLRSFICLGMQKNMDIAEWNSKMLCILSLLSPLSQCVRMNPAKNAPRLKSMVHCIHER